MSAHRSPASLAEHRRIRTSAPSLCRGAEESPGICLADTNRPLLSFLAQLLERGPDTRGESLNERLERKRVDEVHEWSACVAGGGVVRVWLGPLFEEQPVPQ